MLDVCDLIYDAWEDVSERTVASSRIKADILPRCVVNNLIGIHGKVKREKDFIEPDDISAIVEKLSKINLYSPVDSVSCAEFIDAADLHRWVTIENEESIREVLVNKSFDFIENCLMKIIQANDEGEEASVDETPIVTKKLPPLSDVAQLFEGMEALAERAGVVAASEGLRPQSKPFSRPTESRREIEHGRRSFPNMLSKAPMPAMRS